MFAYIIRRLLLIIPTLFGIMIINFLIIQVAPGGPVEQIREAVGHRGRCGGQGGRVFWRRTRGRWNHVAGHRRGGRGVEPISRRTRP